MVKWGVFDMTPDVLKQIDEGEGPSLLEGVPEIMLPTKYVYEETIGGSVFKFPIVITPENKAIAYFHPGRADLAEATTTWMVESIARRYQDNLSDIVVTTADSKKFLVVARRVADQLRRPLVIFPRVKDAKQAEALRANKTSPSRWVRCVPYKSITSPNYQWLGETPHDELILNSYGTFVYIDDAISQEGTFNGAKLVIAPREFASAHFAVSEGAREREAGIFYATHFPVWDGIEHVEQNYQEGGVYQ